MIRAPHAPSRRGRAGTRPPARRRTRGRRPRSSRQQPTRSRRRRSGLSSPTSASISAATFIRRQRSCRARRTRSPRSARRSAASPAARRASAAPVLNQPTGSSIRSRPSPGPTDSAACRRCASVLRQPPVDHLARHVAQSSVAEPMARRQVRAILRASDRPLTTRVCGPPAVLSHRGVIGRDGSAKQHSACQGQRRLPESNRCKRLCRPLRSHSAKAPVG
jgi:hypothetical protein